MNAFKLIARSAAYYWRTHVGVAAGAAVATAVLVGALVVGDSVRYTLRELAPRRLGETTVAMQSPDRFFRAEPAGGDVLVRDDAARRYPRPDAHAGMQQTPPADLASEMEADVGAAVAPVLLLTGSAATPDAAGRANNVQVVGTDARFWHLGSDDNPLAGAASDEAVLNNHLANQLGVGPGDVVILRVPVPSGLPREASLSTERDAVAALRVTVRSVITDAQFGRFSLRANQLAPQSAFVPLAAMQKAVKLPGKANTLLVGRGDTSGAPPTVAQADAALRKHFTLADADLHLRDLRDGVRQLATARVFLDDDVSRAAMRVDHALGVLAYFVDDIRLGDRETPYSIVAGMDANRPGSPPSPVPADLADDEIVLNDWLAKDLAAKPGDTVTLAYRTLGPARTLQSHTATFHVRAVIPIAGPADDPNLMPDFPGLSDVKNCTDWRPGVEIDTDKIRPKDEAYWDAHRGTPKAFLTLQAARKMWANRFGNLTAVQYAGVRVSNAELAAQIIGKIKPSQIGMYFMPVRTRALAAAEPTSDFGGLFLGLSFFLIIAAVLLTGLLFVLGVEQRSRQVGLLLAVGFRPWRVRRWLLIEGGVLAAVGAVVGAAIGLAYTHVVLAGLGSVWRGAAAASKIYYHAEPASVATGAAIGLLVAIAAMLITLWIQGRAQPRELLAAGAQGRVSKQVGWSRRRLSLVLGAALIGGAIAVVHEAAGKTGEAAAGAFFGAGFLVLVGTLLWCYVLLARLGRARHAGPVSVSALGVRSAGLRRGRSLATIALLACGIFLVASVEVFRLDPHANAQSRSSGTGGFALYGQSAAPILRDLNAVAAGQSVTGPPLAIEPNQLTSVNFVQLRVHSGDDASCLNLNRAQSPRVLGADPRQLDGRFTFVGTWPPAAARGAKQNPWLLLDANLPDDAIPAIGDDPTLQWALHKSLGQDVEVVDGRGQTVKLRLVGKIGGSILQGSVLISDANFRRLFPSSGGFRELLIDAPADRARQVRRDLTAALADKGLELTPAADRLAMFAEVQNTYLSIFAALGGLGLILGSVAIGVVVLRNVLERRGELALLRAVGFDKPRLVRMVLWEHWTLLVLGLVCGVVASLVAVAPSLGSQTAAVPVGSWLATLAAIAVSGILWTWLAAAAALRGNLLAALRSE